MATCLHTVLLREDGRAVAFGENDYGQCDVPDVDTAEYVAAATGADFTVLLRKDGRAIAFGNNDHGQCDVPAKQGVRYCAVAAGGQHAVLLREDGRVEAFGNEEACKVPDDDNARYKAVAAGSGHTVLLREDDRAIAFGWNAFGQCDVPDNARYSAVAAGARHTVLLREDGCPLAFGWNDNWQCSGVNEHGKDHQYKAVAAGIDHTVCLREDGVADSFGVCQASIMMMMTDPYREGKRYCRVAAGGDSTMLLKEEGGVEMFGIMTGLERYIPSGDQPFAMWPAVGTKITLPFNPEVLRVLLLASYHGALKTVAKPALLSKIVSYLTTLEEDKLDKNNVAPNSPHVIKRNLRLCWTPSADLVEHDRSEDKGSASQSAQASPNINGDSNKRDQCEAEVFSSELAQANADLESKKAAMTLNSKCLLKEVASPHYADVAPRVTAQNTVSLSMCSLRPPHRSDENAVGARPSVCRPTRVVECQPAGAPLVTTQWIKTQSSMTLAAESRRSWKAPLNSTPCPPIHRVISPITSQYVPTRFANQSVGASHLGMKIVASHGRQQTYPNGIENMLLLHQKQLIGSHLLYVSKRQK